MKTRKQATASPYVSPGPQTSVAQLPRSEPRPPSPKHLLARINRWCGAQSRMGNHRSDQFAREAALRCAGYYSHWTAIAGTAMPPIFSTVAAGNFHACVQTGLFIRARDPGALQRRWRAVRRRLRRGGWRCRLAQGASAHDRTALLPRPPTSAAGFSCGPPREAPRPSAGLKRLARRGRCGERRQIL